MGFITNNPVTLTVVIIAVIVLSAWLTAFELTPRFYNECLKKQQSTVYIPPSGTLDPETTPPPGNVTNTSNSDGDTFYFDGNNTDSNSSNVTDQSFSSSLSDATNQSSSSSPSDTSSQSFSSSPSDTSSQSSYSADDYHVEESPQTHAYYCHHYSASQGNFYGSVVGIGLSVILFFAYCLIATIIKTNQDHTHPLDAFLLVIVVFLPIFVYGYMLYPRWESKYENCYRNTAPDTPDRITNPDKYCGLVGYLDATTSASATSLSLLVVYGAVWLYFHPIDSKDEPDIIYVLIYYGCVMSAVLIPVRSYFWLKEYRRCMEIWGFGYSCKYDAEQSLFGIIIGFIFVAAAYFYVVMYFWMCHTPRRGNGRGRKQVSCNKGEMNIPLVETDV